MSAYDGVHILYDAAGNAISSTNPLFVARRAPVVILVEDAADGSAWGTALQSHSLSQSDLGGVRRAALEITSGSPGPDQALKLRIRRTGSFGDWYSSDSFLPAGGNNYAMVHPEAADPSSGWDTHVALPFFRGPLVPFVIRYGFGTAITAGSSLTIRLYLFYE